MMRVLSVTASYPLIVTPVKTGVHPLTWIPFSNGMTESGFAHKIIISTSMEEAINCRWNRRG